MIPNGRTDSLRIAVIRAVIGMFFLSLWAESANAFEAGLSGLHRQPKSTQLNAWSLPIPTSIPSTWYNEYNPTARRTVYDDVPFEYKFVTLGKDWPSTMETSATSTSNTEVVTTTKVVRPRWTRWARRLTRRPSLDT
jgi:hypothetical protein